MNVTLDKLYIQNQDDVKPDRFQEVRIEKLFLGPAGLSLHLRVERVDIPDNETKKLRDHGVSAKAAYEALRWSSNYLDALDLLLRQRYVND